MAENSGIEWTDHTFNPWIGCTKVSPACDHCYAERVAQRMQVTWGAGEARRRTKPRNWAEPAKWDRQAEAEGVRYRVFCASLADVFDNEVPIEWRLDLFELIRQTPNLDWLLLTKRIGNVMRSLDKAIEHLGTDDRVALARWLQRWRDEREIPSNVWLGATVVNQAEADRDVPKLLATPAHVRFLSIEPMLGAIDLGGLPSVSGVGRYLDALSDFDPGPGADIRSRIDWIIAGGESGPEARPSHPDWFRSLRDQCADAGVPFLFKQWGEWVDEYHPAADPTSQGTSDEFADITFDDEGRADDYRGVYMCHVGKKAAGRLLDGRTHDGLPVWYEREGEST